MGTTPPRPRPTSECSSERRDRGHRGGSSQLLTRQLVWPQPHPRLPERTMPEPAARTGSGASGEQGRGWEVSGGTRGPSNSSCRFSARGCFISSECRFLAKAGKVHLPPCQETFCHQSTERRGWHQEPLVKPRTRTQFQFWFVSFFVAEREKEEELKFWVPRA